MTGSLQIKNNKYYTVLYDCDNKSYKWRSTGLSTKGNKRKATKLLQQRIVEGREKKKQGEGAISFCDFMLQWLETMRT